MSPSFETMLIPLSQGLNALVSAADFPALSAHKWSAARKGGGDPMQPYAYRLTPRPNRTSITMHRELMGFPVGMFVDHINGDTLDCRRENLRICSVQQNRYNSKSGGGASSYKGVYKAGGKWASQIRADRKTYRLGRFDTEVEAAKAYDAAAARIHGEFACLNFPTDASASSAAHIATRYELPELERGKRLNDTEQGFLTCLKAGRLPGRWSPLQGRARRKCRQLGFAVLDARTKRWSITESGLAALSPNTGEQSQ